MDAQPLLRETNWSRQLEHAIAAAWEKEKLFAFSPSRHALTIDTPPPYPSGRPWHIGAAAHYAQIDMIARAARLLGWSVHFPIGIDRNGVPVELYTEKKFGISIHTTPREKFIEYCEKALDELEQEMVGIMKMMGMSADFRHSYRTDSKEYRALTQATFIELWKKGLVYQDARLNNWCPGCRTTVADSEVAYRELPTFLNHVSFSLKGSKETITVATTRPELLCTAALVLFNPADERYTKLKNRTAVVPLFGHEVPIIAHPIADPAFGSGLVYMSRSAGDLNAVRFLREMDIPYEVCITEEGRMNEKAGPFAGMKVKEAREAVRQQLKAAGLLVKEEQISHRTPVCERSKHEIEYIAMPEFYLKQLPFLPQLKQYAEDLSFHPPEHRQILLDWIAGVSMDWPISRRRYYATEIPLWYCAACREPHVPEPGRYYQPWKQKAPFKACTRCTGTAFVGEDRTFDTWMDSSISALVVTRYFTDKAFYKQTSKAILRPQAKDIIRTWLFYSLLRCHQLTGRNIFAHAWIMGYGVDDKGEKMSKSKGNVVDPVPIIERHGADTFRFWAAQEASLGSDFRCSEERMAGAGKFLTKLWNTARFISSFPPPPGRQLHFRALDEWILGEVQLLVEECRRGYEDFNFFIPANRTRAFLWNVFAPHYLELAKARAYAGDAAACWTLHSCLRTLLTLLCPITPFITDHLHRALYQGTVFSQPFPDAGKPAGLPFSTADLLDLNSALWKAKKDRGLSLKSPIARATLPEKFRALEQELKETHHISEVTYGTSLEVHLS